MRSAVLFPVLAVCLSCGADDANDPGLPQCTLFLVPPSTGTVGEEVEVRATYDLQSFNGVPQLSFAVDRSGEPVEHTVVEEDRITFVPTAVGPHRVVVSGEIGASFSSLACPSATATINVVSPNALTQEYLLRIAPTDGGPVQEELVTVYGGTEIQFPDFALQRGVSLSSTVTFDAQGVEGYLRASSEGTVLPSFVETFSDSAGEFAMQVRSGFFDLLFVPTEPNIPSRVFAELSSARFPLTFALPAPVTVSGSVVDNDLQPVSGASIRLEVDGALSASGQSDAQGDFQLQAYEGSLTGVFVVPPEGSGLPVLRATGLTTQSVASETPVDIRYTRSVQVAQFNVDDSLGQPLSGAEIVVRADLPNSASVQSGGSEAIAGQARGLGTTGAGGALSLALPEGTENFELLVHTETQGLAASQAIESGVATELQTLERSQTTLSVTSLGVAAVGARVSLEPTGILDPSIASESATVGSEGNVQFSRISGGEYQLRVVKDSQRFGPIPLGESTSLALPPTVRASGRVLRDGVPVANAAISLHCLECDGPEATEARALGVTGEAGRFQLVVEDPGEK